MSWKMNYQEHQVVPLLSAKGLGKILDSEGIIEYFCQAIFLCLNLYNEQFLSD